MNWELDKPMMENIPVKDPIFFSDWGRLLSVPDFMVTGLAMENHKAVTQNGNH
jgi:hypothetical protein